MSLLRKALNHYPLMTPRASILRRLPAVPSGLSFHTRYGTIRGYHPGRDNVSLSLYWFADFDPWVDATLQRLARPGEIAIDVGANIGTTTLLLSRTVGIAGKVISFEPSPRNVARLRENLAANDACNVEVQEIGLSAFEAAVMLAEPEGQPGMSLISSLGSIPIRVTPLDAWLEGRPEISSISVCKIDVEGHEPEVFEGMRKTLSTRRISALVFEHHSTNEDASVLNSLRQHGYKVYRIEKSPVRAHYTPIDRQRQAAPTSDFVAIDPKSHAGDRLGC